MDVIAYLYIDVKSKPSGSGGAVGIERTFGPGFGAVASACFVCVVAGARVKLTMLVKFCVQISRFVSRSKGSNKYVAIVGMSLDA